MRLRSRPCQQANDLLVLSREGGAFRCCRGSRYQWVDRFRGLLTRRPDRAGQAHEFGYGVVERFIKDTVGVTRVTIAEADRFPALSRHLHEAARDRAADAVSHLLNDATDPLSRTSKGAFGNKRSIATAQIFMDLILLPMLMRSLMGDEARALRRDLPSFVRERVNFFLAACEADWKW